MRKQIVVAMVSGLPMSCSAGSQSVSDSGQPEPGASDVGAPDAATSGMDASVDAGPCGTVVNVASMIIVSAVATDPPVPSGGTIADGIYAMTVEQEYTGDGGASGPIATTSSISLTRQFAGGSYQLVGRHLGGIDQWSSGTYSTSGTTFTQTETCPASNEDSYQYSSDGVGTVTFYFPNPVQILAQTFIKQ
jgi:hypothetical protein